jgi:DNA-binding GntR family transcriptional regulator
MQKGERKNIREIIYTQLKRDILSGTIGPGEKLTEVNLGKRYKCSRTPVRESLVKLQSEHYVNYIPNKGATVAKLSIQKINEIFLVRAVLESHAVMEASVKFTESDLKKMITLHEKMRRNASEEDYEAYAENNTQFHLYCAQVSRNETLYDMIKELLTRLNPYEYFIAALPGYLGYWLSGHKQVIDGLLEGNFEGAAHGIRDHIEDARKITLNYIKRLPGMYAKA